MDAPISELDNWPFVLQLAWRVYSKTGELIKEENHFIWEPDIFIEEGSIDIHGITESDLRAKGEDRKAVMWLFLNDLKKYRPIIVGHFVEFDSKMLQVAFVRCGLQHNLRKYKHFCTMRVGKVYSRYINHDFPKLSELYFGLFGERMPAQHDAAIDARATARCFFELHRKGEITDDMLGTQRLFVSVKERVNGSGCGLSVVILAIFGMILYLI